MNQKLTNMMSKKSILVTVLSLSLFAATESRAAFPVKKAVATEAAAPNMPTTAVASNESAENATSAATEVTHSAVKKQSFFKRLLHRIEERAAISQGAYIVLSIFWLGWLAMGLNDDFEGFDWVLSLILYILFYFPGL